MAVRCDSHPGVRWQGVRTRQAEFHQEESRVLKLALSGQKAAAEAALIPLRKMGQITQLLTREIIHGTQAVG